MTSQLVDKVNDAQLRWRQIDSELAVSRNLYIRQLENAYDVHREYAQKQNDLLAALLQMAAQPAPVPAPQTPPLPDLPREDNL